VKTTKGLAAHFGKEVKRLAKLAYTQLIEEAATSAEEGKDC
jgi:hypothetical protein